MTAMLVPGSEITLPRPGRFAAAIAAFDRANAADPVLEEVDGEPYPRALLYGCRMTDWLDHLYPEASEALRLAARCQHIERWKIPRHDYPGGRVGYLTWRSDLKAYHADRAASILSDLGVAEATIARVKSLIRKERLKQDSESQALEDAACLVFLAHQFDAFAPTHTPEKMLGILRKTWRKMSARGHRAALALTFGPECKELIEAALAGPD